MLMLCLKASLCLVTQLCPTLYNPMGYSPPGPLRGDSPDKNTGVGAIPPPGDLPNSRIEPRSPNIAGGFFTI